MSNLSHLMREYFSSPDCKKNMFGLITENKATVPGGLPVKPNTFAWQVLKEPERYFRQFEFEDRRRLVDFVDDVLHFEDDLVHHAQIVISHKTVSIEVNTKTVESITNLDQEYVKGVDNIFQDVEFYRYKNDGK